MGITDQMEWRRLQRTRELSRARKRDDQGQARAFFASSPFWAPKEFFSLRLCFTFFLKANVQVQVRGGRSFNFGNFHLNCCALSPFGLFLTMRAIQASSNYDFCTLFNLRFRCEHSHTHTHMNARILSLSFLFSVCKFLS